MFLPALIVAMLGLFSCPQDASATDDGNALRQGFQAPPNTARPRVWWHWLNANISRDGIRKDLEWMQRSGIGGLQNFDVNFAVPTIVPERIPYMSEEWKKVYRYSVELADELGLEFGIAASPGWSETGGPWVKPQDGMKKLVWSVTPVTGGARFTDNLRELPSVTGPFQDLPPPKELNPTPKKADPVYHADIVVLAYPAADKSPVHLPVITLDGEAVPEAALLGDGQFNTGIEVPRGTADVPTRIELSYAQPQSIRSATLFIPDISDIYSGPTVSATLEAKAADDSWRKITDIRLSTVPTTVSFPVESAAQFRVSIKPVPTTRSNSGGAAPGFDTAFMKAMAAIYGANKNLPLNELSLSPVARINQFEVKAGFSVAPDYYALNSSPDADAPAVTPAEVIELTDRLQPDGTLDWTPPAGRWQVLRLGYSLLGKTNHPAIEEATGLEVDKLDGAAVRRYVETYLQNYRDAVGPALIGKRGITALLTDSTEVGAFNWTPGMLRQFKKLRGYDALPWMPALTGVIVGSREESDKFLYDYRRTIAELHATEHYGTVATVAHENGLKVYGESLEGWRPSLGDDMGMRRFADYPMAALWSYSREEGPKPLYFADMRGAASVAHLYGKPLAAAESMTSTRHPWYHVPADLRRVVDLEFLHGINRVVIHSSVHQPVDDKQPGLSLRHIGQFFNRHTAWAEMARAWIDYIARSSYLLQQGRFVADVAYFYGEEAPLGPQTWDGYFADVPSRHAYDFVNPDAIFNVLQVDKGDLVTSGGARYKLLYLGGTSERMTLPMLRRIADLVEGGATVVGSAPMGSPGLNDDGVEYSALVEKLWSGKAFTMVGRGRVIAGKNVEAALGMLGVAPDLQFIDPPAGMAIPFVHRRLENGEIYFLSNRNNRPEKIEARFRVSGKAPQIWRADYGTIEPASYRFEGDETVVPLSFDAEESYFVVFLEEATDPSRIVTESNPIPVATLDGPWKVSFEAGRGAPESATLSSLAPLNENTDSGIRYFSGVATYTTTFSLPPGYQLGKPLLLDLGKVGDLAQVWLNGLQIATLWHEPFRTDISAAVKKGDNQLEIRVANRWVNRLIGDAQPDAEKVTYTVMPMYDAQAPLLPSGLIGPVQLLQAGDH